MKILKYWEDKIKKNITNTDFRDFLKNQCSWVPLIFYKRNELISTYPNTNRIRTALAYDEYEKIIDDMVKYSIDYDFGADFFQNYKKLFSSVPLISLRQFPPFETSQYSESTGLGVKKCYLNIGVCLECENILYCLEVKENCKNILNSVMVWDSCYNIYQSNCILKSFNIFYSKFIYNCNNTWFSTNLVGCMECIFCDNLENQSYCINNKKYDKEEYYLKKNSILQEKNSFYDYYSKIDNKGNNNLSEDVEGSFLIKSSNIKEGYFSYNIHDGKNVILSGSVNGNNNIYNTAVTGSPFGDNLYNVLNSGGGDNMYNCDFTMGTNMYYCYFSFECSYCIGCIGLRNKSYCILNKQYTKEEWNILATKIFEQMDNNGILGKPLPGIINPYYFNDTLAYLIDDTFTKEEVERQGYMWRDGEIKVDIPEGSELIETKDLNIYQGYDENRNWKIDPEIMKKVIKDKKGNIYRIVKMEYDFLMKHGLPLPEIHWLDRIKKGFKF